LDARDWAFYERKALPASLLFPQVVRKLAERARREDAPRWRPDARGDTRLRDLSSFKDWRDEAASKDLVEDRRERLAETDPKLAEIIDVGADRTRKVEALLTEIEATRGNERRRLELKLQLAELVRGASREAMAARAEMPVSTLEKRIRRAKATLADPRERTRGSDRLNDGACPAGSQKALEPDPPKVPCGYCGSSEGTPPFSCLACRVTTPAEV
jgi:hypothetical protein